MANKTKQVRVRLSRIDFFRLRGEEFFEALFQCISHELGDDRQRTKRWARLNRHQQGLYAWWWFLVDVPNGGLTQFFYNHTDVFVTPLAGLLKTSSNAPLATLLKQATKVYRTHKKEFAVENPFGADGLFARMTELAKLNRSVERQLGRTSKQLEKWLRANISRVAVGDLGEAIDPKFSGEVETYHPNGKVFEQATIRRGVLSGKYLRNFEDGILEHTCFYKGGKVSADYWPNEQPRHKTMKRGKLKIDEWYYPSGNIQKRYVADKTGYTVEPVRLWHENGQLAEEIDSKGLDKFGPWLKFFEDGAPRLQAKFLKNETLVVHNAWDDQRRQVVKNGRGTYFDDGLDIDTRYKLFATSGWTSLQGLRDGVPHGAGTDWIDGILSSKQEFAKGKRHGVNTFFYDNGRVQARISFRNGKEIKSENFPKFDNPRPAILLSVEANADLYNAWGHRLLDVYPTPRNLKTVQRKLKVPEFLNEVFERNKSGKVEDDYEDVNIFNDGVAYMVMVDERGTVDDVEFSGCGVYSRGTIPEYPPIIRELRFKPGSVKGRKMRCRVVVHVDHTFVEAGPQQ